MKDRYRHRRRASYQAWEKGYHRDLTYYVDGELIATHRVFMGPGGVLNIPLLPEGPNEVETRLTGTIWHQVAATYTGYKGATLLWWQKKDTGEEATPSSPFSSRLAHVTIRRNSSKKWVVQLAANHDEKEAS